MISTQSDKSPTSTAYAQAASQDTADVLAHRMSTMRHLIAAMLLGQMYGLHEDAEVIYQLASETTGEGRQLRISLAFASAMAGDASPAKALLAEGMDDWPDAELAQSSVALALKMAGEPSWRYIPEKVMACSTNQSARQFAQALLAQA